LRLTGPAARVTIVWRFERPNEVRLNGAPLALETEGGSASVTFAHARDDRLAWW
jgi:hypothetical protein